MSQFEIACYGCIDNSVYIFSFISNSLTYITVSKTRISYDSVDMLVCAKLASVYSTEGYTVDGDMAL